MSQIIRPQPLPGYLEEVLQPKPKSCLNKVLPIALLAIGAVAIIANAISCDDEPEKSDDSLIVH